MKLPYQVVGPTTPPLFTEGVEPIGIHLQQEKHSSAWPTMIVLNGSDRILESASVGAVRTRLAASTIRRLVVSLAAAHPGVFEMKRSVP